MMEYSEMKQLYKLLEQLRSEYGNMLDNLSEVALNHKTSKGIRNLFVQVDDVYDCFHTIGKMQHIVSDLYEDMTGIEWKEFYNEEN